LTGCPAQDPDETPDAAAVTRDAGTSNTGGRSNGGGTGGTTGATDASVGDGAASDAKADGATDAEKGDGRGGSGDAADMGNGLLDKLRTQTMYSSKPTGAATWLVNGDSGSARGKISSDMNAAGQSKFPVFTLYHFNKDSGTSASAYHDWVSAIADEIGKHNGNAVVVVEPDSFALNNVSGVDNVLDDAIAVLKQKAPNAAVFLDVGHSNWLSAGGVVSRAKNYPHYAQIDGWATNTSNFQPEANEEAYGKNLFSQSGKPSIIDSSRNGLGTVPSTIINPPANEWKPGPTFAFHSADSGVLFNYYNKPSDERD
jgi:hypothetical protein